MIWRFLLENDFLCNLRFLLLPGAGAAGAGGDGGGGGRYCGWD